MKKIETDPKKHQRPEDVDPTKGDIVVPYCITETYHPTDINNLGNISGATTITLDWPMNLNQNWFPRPCCRGSYYPYWHLFKALKEARKHPPHE